MACRFGLALLGCVSWWAPFAWGAPVTAGHAETATRKWLAICPRPMERQISQQIAQVRPYAGPDGETAYYVVSLKPAGFVILPADDLAGPILCFSTTGFYDPSEQNCLAALVSEDVKGRLSEARALQKAQARGQALPAHATGARARWDRLLEADSASEQEEPSITDVRVDPFVQSRWSQGSECGSYCYNYYTPNHYVCGCVATALAQTMRFHEHPLTGVGTASFTIRVCGISEPRSLRGGDGLGGPYNWADMKLDPDCSITTIQREAIGALCHDAGVAVKMDYCDSSGADTLMTAEALKNTFGYSNAVKGGKGTLNIGEGLIGMINPNLDAGFPVILGITGAGGHAIVADGYGYMSGVLYHHLNMGWAGSSDAWYELPNIRSYTSVYKCVYNIYVSGSGEIISGRVTKDDGSPLAGATVTAVRSGGGTYTDTTNSRGIYALVKVPSNSNYEISVAAENYEFTAQNISTSLSSNLSYTSGNVWGVDFVGQYVYVNPCPPLFGDSNSDNDVDQEDFGAFQACLGGAITREECICFDRDKDSHINNIDLTAFRNCMTGAALPSDPPIPPEGCSW